ncbi:DUF5703 domain-containing protein [Dyadobacter pollutisoli]|uniref:DUF5703 domain-containing protein n=1 Tax=Dyadobacter pollutisoli TaxID=2910158 RepID=A0A9E8NC67_9BACT|nr:DUF5703 domain-containing protein [Dyadobacter pollutisoli]WAC13960.1 DUF5703 domain-containing protein [Dyadobacter pollutisoli]
MSKPPLLRLLFFCLIIFCAGNVTGQTFSAEMYDLKWKSQSTNSGESMPCGGGDIGLNVWVEKGDILFYMSRSGTLDENNVFPKLGRVRIKLYPNPFEAGSSFEQELKLKEGYVLITGQKGNLRANVKIWVDVFRPVVQVEVSSSKPVQMVAAYESWRTRDRELKGLEKNSSSFKWVKEKVVVFKDSIQVSKNGVLFYHRNRDSTVFDKIVTQQKLDPVKLQLWNPLKGLTYGGFMTGNNMVRDESDRRALGKYASIDFQSFKLKSKTASRSHRLNVYLHIGQTESIDQWKKGLGNVQKEALLAENQSRQKTLDWWKQYWEKSHIALNISKVDHSSPVWQVGRNYQLFRYMLGCNAFGTLPTKFNGGLFTYDPVFVDSAYKFSPDHRNWGGGTFTAQNQRLVYGPMLKSGDSEWMKPQFEFYQKALGNAEIRTKHYWGHGGPSFTEQMEYFGLPNYAEYGSKRPADFDPGLEFNPWLEYLWDTSLEFCFMILEKHRFTREDISRYLRLIESCVDFFDEHYQYLASKRSAKTLDQNGKLVLYPGSSAETYKMAYNSTTTIAGLTSVLDRLIQLQSPTIDGSTRAKWIAQRKRIPPLSFREMEGHKTIAPAQAWERIQNTEIPQLYPVFPFGMYGIGQPDLNVAINTWKYDTDAIKNRNYTSWHQDNIFCARLGLTEEAAALTIKKLQDSGRRFPAFWGPGHDWVPDHNWGGSGMIGLQEMLMQTVTDTIYLFPAWPKEWDVNFKLHAPYQTIVEGELKNGILVNLYVIPESRRKDIVVLSDVKLK